MIYFTEMFHPSWYTKFATNNTFELCVTKLTQAELKEIMKPELGINACQLTSDALKAIKFLDKPITNGARIENVLTKDCSVIWISFEIGMNEKKVYDVIRNFYLINVKG